MLGLEVDGRPLMRAYSIASPNHAEELEFFSIKVQNGPLTSRLQHLSVGDSILIGRKPTGTLVLDNLRDGRNLYLLATGTGLAPFLSIIRDPDTYEAHTLQVFSLNPAGISRNVVFQDPKLFELFDLPLTLAAASARP